VSLYNVVTSFGIRAMTFLSLSGVAGGPGHQRGCSTWSSACLGVGLRCSIRTIFHSKCHKYLADVGDHTPCPHTQVVLQHTLHFQYTAVCRRPRTRTSERATCHVHKHAHPTRPASGRALHPRAATWQAVSVSVPRHRGRGLARQRGTRPTSIRRMA
jgi:hypothetical protein